MKTSEQAIAMKIIKNLRDASVAEFGDTSYIAEQKAVEICLEGLAEMRKLVMYQLTPQMPTPELGPDDFQGASDKTIRGGSK